MTEFGATQEVNEVTKVQDELGQLVSPYLPGNMYKVLSTSGIYLGVVAEVFEHEVVFIGVAQINVKTLKDGNVEISGNKIGTMIYGRSSIAAEFFDPKANESIYKLYINIMNPKKEEDKDSK